MDNISNIRALAERMRRALESVPMDARPPSMSAFPRGACGDASLLLGAYLADNGYPGFLYVCGERGKKEDGSWTSHAWLSKGGLIVDITADQFRECFDSIVVGEASRFHKSFDIEATDLADFRAWTGFGTIHLHTLYSGMKPDLFDNATGSRAEP